MGMNAEVLAIGPFQSAIVPHLEYGADLYSKTREGAPVIRFLFECEHSPQSRELAACFGVEPWDFNQHHLNPSTADVQRLTAAFDAADVEVFVALRAAGFDFYYVPNG
jgi:hypothetical protein